uniref:Uncharacterized protein n=1 Tax=Anguilla anguilla TaxID=7936 RepID=A0A0E9TSL4_ANGAN
MLYEVVLEHTICLAVIQNIQSIQRNISMKESRVSSPSIQRSMRYCSQSNRL